VKPPADIGVGKAIKCPMCTAVVPIPVGYKPESPFVPTPSPEVDEGPETPSAPAAVNHSFSQPAWSPPPVSAPLADSGFSSAPAATATATAPSTTTSAVTETSHHSEPDTENLRTAWIVFGLSAGLFVVLLVLWGLAESGMFGH
jgi:hypothetical protein